MLKKIIYDNTITETTSVNSMAKRLCLKVMRRREYSSAEAAMLLQQEKMVHSSSSVKSIGDPRSRPVKKVKNTDGVLSGDQNGAGVKTVEVDAVHENLYDKYMKETLGMRAFFAAQPDSGVADEADEVHDHQYKSYDEHMLQQDIGETGIGALVPNYRFKKKCTWPVTEQYADFCLKVYKRGIGSLAELNGTSTSAKEEFLRLLKLREMPSWIENELRRAWLANANSNLVQEHKESQKKSAKKKTRKKHGTVIMARSIVLSQTEANL